MLLQTDEIEAVRESITDSKYEHISSLISQVLSSTTSEITSLTSKIDRFITHRFLGLPIFAAVMFAVFYFTFNLFGNPLTNLFDAGFCYVLELCNNVLISLN